MTRQYKVSNCVLFQEAAQIITVMLNMLFNRNKPVTEIETSFEKASLRT